MNSYNDEYSTHSDTNNIRPFFIGYSNPGLANSELSNYSKKRLVDSKSSGSDEHHEIQNPSRYPLNYTHDYNNNSDSITYSQESIESINNYDNPNLSIDSFNMDSKASSNLRDKNSEFITNVFVPQQKENLSISNNPFDIINENEESSKENHLNSQMRN